MIPGRHILWTTVAGAALSSWLVAAASHSGSTGFGWRSTESSIALMSAGKPVWRFQYGKDLTKPMFDPVALPDGTVLTWNSPPDHPWHHALWFSWKYLNHANYWEEGRAVKTAAGLTQWRNVSIAKGPDFSARVRLNLEYHEPNQPPVLEETRTIRVSAPADGQYHLDWTMTFTARDQDVDINRSPILGEPKGQPTGGYAGLSVRLASDFSNWKVVSTKGPVPQDPTVPFHCETGATGVDFGGAVAGQDAGVAFLDHPSNLNSPTPWYTVMNGAKDFSFAQAAVIYYRPLILKARQSLTLRYRVVVHEKRWSAENLRGAEVKYLKEVQEKK